MRRLLLLSLLLACNVILVSGFPQKETLTASTKEAQLVERGAGVMFMLSEEEYKKAAEKLATWDKFVPLKRKPDKLTPDAKFGYNFVVSGKNTSWVIDGNDKNGYTIYFDLNTNGDLTDDSAPLRFEQQKDGKYSLLYKSTFLDEESANKESYPVTIKLVIGEVPPPGETQMKPCMFRYSDTFRQGVIRVGGKDVVFGFIGSLGIYNRDYNSVLFDMNGDGQLDRATAKSLEVYKLSEKYVNLGDTSYEFIVNRYGNSLTLKPLAEKLPDRVILLPGYPAPDFSFTDLEGKTRKLSDYRGKIVLLDFWGTWCAPCIEEVPTLKELYQKFNAKGVEILGISSDKKEEILRTFLSEKKMTWTQIMEGEGGAIHKLYRVSGWPTYFVIDRDGKIISNRIAKWADFLKELETLVGDNKNGVSTK